MFRKNKCKKRKKVTETLTVNGYDVIIISNISIEKKGVKKSIAEYAVSAIDFEEQIVIRIKQLSGGKKNNVLANKDVKLEEDKSGD